MLEIIGAGFGRTGTVSLKTALERLGFGPCYNSIELIRHPEHLPWWEAALDGIAEWAQVFAGYRVTLDWPGVHFWRELVDTYPNAKIILTVRDPRRWYSSVRNTFLSFSAPVRELPFLADAGMTTEEMERFGRLMERIGEEGFGDRIQDEQAAIVEFERHIEQVCSYVPNQQLLVYEIARGWEPLCAFLEVDVPEGEPFPWLNDSKSFMDQVSRMVAKDHLTHPPTPGVYP